MVIDSIEKLEALYGTPKATALVKVADHITGHYRQWIEAAPFCALATVGPEGLDATPRGDEGQVCFVLDKNTLALPDRIGNNRIDSLRNIVRDPRVSLMFLIPGSGTVIRVNGSGKISADPALLERFTKSGKAPRSVLLVDVAEVYFQCSRAVLRSGLWEGRETPDLPSVGEMLKTLSGGVEGGAEYDKSWPERARKNLW